MSGRSRWRRRRRCRRPFSEDADAAMWRTLHSSRHKADYTHGRDDQCICGAFTASCSSVALTAAPTAAGLPSSQRRHQETGQPAGVRVVKTQNTITKICTTTFLQASARWSRTFSLIIFIFNFWCSVFQPVLTSFSFFTSMCDFSHGSIKQDVQPSACRPDQQLVGLKVLENLCCTPGTFL